MAPPTRHSSRLGVAGLAAAHKEDENAGIHFSERPVNRTLRGRKDVSVPPKVDSKAPPVNSKSGLVTANVRKRILDDRTNSIKPNSITSTAAATKSNVIKKEFPRKLASSAVRKTTPLPEQAETLPARKLASRQAAQKESAKARSGLARRTASSAASQASETSDKPGPSSRAQTVPKLNPVASTVAGTTRSRRASGRSITSTVSSSVSSRKDDPHVNIIEHDDAGHVTKKPRTDEPVSSEKENVRQSKPSKPTSKIASLDKRKKNELRVLAGQLLPKARILLKDGEEGWEDLDEGDEDDPLMVKEYVNEIYHYMRQLEVETLPDADYMSRQNELTWKMRGVLVDWMIEVHSKFRLLPETLYLAINLMDRFLTKRTVALIKFQLVGVTALFLAAKYEEVICPSVTNFLYMTDGGYDCEEILKAETYMLEMLEWDLRYPNPLNFLRRVSKADHYDIQSRTFAKYFMEISIVDHRLVATPPSLLAATSIWLARKLLDRGCWTANLIHYSGFTEPEILPCAQTMVDYILRSGCKSLGMGLEPNFVGAVGYEGGNEHGNLFKKYATRKFFRVSELVREWAVDRYAFETPTGWEWDTLEEWAEPSRDRVGKEGEGCENDPDHFDYQDGLEDVEEEGDDHDEDIDGGGDEENQVPTVSLGTARPRARRVMI